MFHRVQREMLEQVVREAAVARPVGQWDIQHVVRMECDVGKHGSSVLDVLAAQIEAAVLQR